jgi:hypothetical protein
MAVTVMTKLNMRSVQMNKQQAFSRTLLALALAAIGATGTALALEEVEQNAPIQSAQELTVGAGGSVTVNGVIGNVTGVPVLDVDFYSFQGQEGDSITVDIDGTTTFNDIPTNTILTLFGPDPDYTVLIRNDNNSLDQGSTTERDARIDPPFRLPRTGKYTVAVTTFPVNLTHKGTLLATQPVTNGKYTLIISGVTTLMQQINIEVKPGSGDFAPLNPKAKGTIPVALLSSKDFNALDVEVNNKTLTFGRTGEEYSLKRCAKEGEDVNGDGYPDLVCHFDNEMAKFRRGDLSGVLKGKTKSAKPFQGHGDLKTVVEKQDD